jgi:hypothetical protein
MAELEKSVMDIFREGLFARALGRPASGNPYSLQSVNHEFWLCGWSEIDEMRDFSAPPFDGHRAHFTVTL